MTFAEPEIASTLNLRAKHAVAHTFFGSALRHLQKALEEKPNKEFKKAIGEVS